jgi:acylphosphatase
MDFNMENNQTLHIIVTGKVQGVYFRQSTQLQARARELTGWVKNLANGDVEIMVSGPTSELENFKEWAKTGPPQAQVKSLEIKELPFQSFDNFTIIR